MTSDTRGAVVPLFCSSPQYQIVLTMFKDLRGIRNKKKIGLSSTTVNLEVERPDTEQIFFYFFIWVEEQKSGFPFSLEGR